MANTYNGVDPDFKKGQNYEMFDNLEEAERH